MSDVPVSQTVGETVQSVEQIASSSTSIWVYVLGGLVVLGVAGFFAFRKMNTPAFIISQVRRRNQKEMKKQGIEQTEAMVDLDRLFASVVQYAESKGMKGTEAVKLLAPVHDKERVKSAADMYQAMIKVCKTTGDEALARDLKTKAGQVKSSSPLMAGLLKRAGIK